VSPSLHLGHVQLAGRERPSSRSALAPSLPTMRGRPSPSATHGTTARRLDGPPHPCHHSRPPHLTTARTWGQPPNHRRPPYLHPQRRRSWGRRGASSPPAPARRWATGEADGGGGGEQRRSWGRMGAPPEFAGDGGERRGS